MAAAILQTNLPEPVCRHCGFAPYGHTSDMPAEVPVFRLESAFFNLVACGDRSFAASAGCRSGSSACRPSRRRHVSSGNVQHQHPGTQLLERTMGTLAGHGWQERWLVARQGWFFHTLGERFYGAHWNYSSRDERTRPEHGRRPTVSAGQTCFCCPSWPTRRTRAPKNSGRQTDRPTRARRDERGRLMRLASNRTRPLCHVSRAE
jgi:hypothetical protein